MKDSTGNLTPFSLLLIHVPCILARGTEPSRRRDPVHEVMGDTETIGEQGIEDTVQLVCWFLKAFK